MKTVAATISVITVSALTLFAQGRVQFNNLVSGNAITVSGIRDQGPGAGAAGASVGANYSIQLLWAPVGTYTNENALVAAALGSSAATPFFGTTGGSPTTDGAGLFDAGTVPNPVGTSMLVGNYTMLARAWFNNGQFATYDLAKVSGRNTGYIIFNQSATAFPAGAPSTIFPSFTVGLIIPEPSTFALVGLGAACLLLFRRRK